jgi:AraC-like DNA-binding protein
MLRRIHRPVAPLSQFIDFFWFHTDLVSKHRMERVLPDGTFELVINLDPIPRKLFERDDLRRYREFRRAWWSGTQSEFIVIDALPCSSMMGIHFRPGGAAPFLGMPATELRDQVIETDFFCCWAALDLHECLLEQPTPEAKFKTLEKFLLRLACGRLEHSAAVRHSIGRFMAVPHESSIRRMAAELGISHKQFIRRFRDEVGLTPKRFCRIRRFQQVLRQIQQLKAIEWADIASACGYYDQAHFIHDFHAFSGLNPSAYLTERGEYLNFVPIRR